jgi:hypothetical protein
VHGDLIIVEQPSRIAGGRWKAANDKARELGWIV